MNNIEDIYSLSPTQHGLLFHSVVEADSRVYYQQLSLEIQGPLDTTAFRSAWQALMQRHAVLRSAFLWEDLDDAYQVVQQGIELPLSLLDWRARDDQQAALEALALEQRALPLELNDAPLMRVALVRLAEQRWHLTWTFHHILMDGWSVGIAIQEWLALYYESALGRPARLPATRPYRDYIAWLAEQDMAATEAFWRERLHDLNEPTPLPDFAVRLAPPTGAPFAERETLLQADETEQLTRFARQHGLTLNTLIQGAWALLLGQHAGRDDVVYGVTVAGRPESLPGVESSVGLFINTLPLRVQWADSPALVDWLHALQQANSDLRQHAYLPVGKLKAMSGIAAERALFDSILVFENFPVTDALNQDADGLSFIAPQPARTVDGITHTQGRNHFPLALIVVPGERLNYLFSYERRRFSDAEIAVLSAQLRALLLAMAAQPHGRVAELAWVSPEEQAQLQAHGRGAQLPVPTLGLHQRFEQQALTHPEREALRDRQGALSYAELERRANQLSQHLHSQGIGAGSLVALGLERNADFVIALLATLKAGAAYLPLDLKQPVGRLADVLADSRAALLIGATASPALTRLAEHTPALWLNEAAAHIAAQPAHAPDVQHPADAAAYVIYTSGSTGTPKGVVVEHRAIVDYLGAVQALLDAPAAARYALLSSVAADLGHTQLFGALCSGASLLLVDDDSAFSPLALAELFEQQPVDVLKITPSHLGGLLQALPDARLLPRSRLVFGGDALSPELLDKVRSLAPHLRVFNHYGPSEATVGAIATELPAGLRSIPLGRPLPNRQLRVVDAHGQAVATGVSGELLIGGALARGYLHRPDLTDERFSVDAQQQRWYRTGDRVRWLEDGQLAFLGRVDSQVKIRGNRLELGEVEAQIRRLSPSIEQVLVRAVELDGSLRLVAWLVASQSLSPAKLRDDLAMRVPDYMVPAHFISLDELPLNRNGKVDASRLPLPAQPVDDSASHVAPRNEVEALLADIWQDVLKRDRVGVHDNFFALGGDSILNLQIIARANQQGLKLTPRQLFENRTIADIARVLGADASGAVADAASQGLELPLGAGQCARLDSGALQATWRCVALTRNLDNAVLAQALGAVQQHHQALRLALQRPPEGHWHQRVLAQALAPQVDVRDLAELGQAPLQALAEQAVEGLALDAGQTLHASLLTHSGQPYLLLAAHPLCLDEASWPLLLDDLNLALAQQLHQRPLRLAYNGGDFSRWTQHQQAYAQGDGLDEAWEHWLQFVGMDLLALPPPQEQPAIGVAEHRVSAETSRALKRLLEMLQLDWNALLAAAVAEQWRTLAGNGLIALALQAGRPQAERLAVNAPISTADLEPQRIIGALEQPVPFYLQVQGDNLLQRLQATAAQLRAYPQLGSDYGVLRYLSDNSYLQEPLRDLPTPPISIRWQGDRDSHREPRAVMGRLTAASQSPAPGSALVLDACWQDDCLHLHATGALAADWLPQLLQRLNELAALLAQPELRPHSAAFPLCHQQAATLAAEPLDWENIEDLYPLSSMQQGMLLHTLLQPHSGIYLMQQRYSWDGDLQRPAMQAAWQLFLERHPMMRTAFWWQDDHAPLQCVLRQADPAFDWQDLRHLDADAQRLAMDQALEAQHQQGFDMARAPLTHLRIFQLDERRFAVVRSFHHILTDAWCFGLLMEDLLAIYQAMVRHEPVARPRLRSFRGYMSWLERQDMAAAQAFWQADLAGFSEPTPLAVDTPLADEQQPAEAVGDQDCTLSISQTRRLQELCQHYQLTPNTWIQGAWALLLSRYSGNRDVLFGVTVAGRPTELAGVEEMVGIFINSLPLRVDVDPQAPVAEWLQALLSHNARLREHESASLVDIQRCSDVPRGQALFDSLVVFENAPLDISSVQLDNFSIDIYEDRVHTNFPMTVVLYPGDRLGIRLSYDTRRFSADTVQRMLGHLVQLLGGMLEQPEARLDTLWLLAPTERQQLLVDYNRSDVDFPLQRGYAALFAEQVSRRGQQVAAVCQGESLSYAELDRRSNAVAHALQTAGAGPETLVALFAERGLALLTLMIGTLKAGAAFQALDIQQPPARLAELLALGEAPLLLVCDQASAVLDQVLPNLQRQPTCLVAQPLWQGAAQPAVSYNHDPDQLAYVIFTSGSTGQPKGVMVEQRGMLNNMFGKVPALGLGEHDRIAQTASPAFDISVWQFLAAPLFGATVHILPDAQAHDPLALLDAVEAHGLTLLETVPALIRGMLQESSADHRLASLRWLLPTGEALPPALARDWLTRFPHVPMMNAYGPAECSDDVAFHAITQAADADCLHMPIGLPTANNQLFVLDAELRLLPVGVPGELCIGGVGVGRGYLRDPQRTREAFVEHPFEPGARLYRSGDIGRLRADGVFEYLGRRDQQVKIRGHRIELGEIENRLMQHPAVSSAAVLARPDARGALQLVAWYVLEDDAALDADAAQAVLSTYLGEQLAAYMLPARWVNLAQLPLNANGKVDRRALAALDLPQDQQPQDLPAAPRSDTEKVLAELWQQLLGLDSVSVHDDFFAIGGHSLLATQMLSRIRRHLAVDLPLRTLFEGGTLEQLAQAVERQREAQGAVEPGSEMVPVPRDQQLPLSFAQQRLWFLDRLEGPSAAYNMGSVVRLRGALNVAALQAALHSVLERHEALRTAFQLVGEQPCQVIAPVPALDLTPTDLSQLVGEAQQQALQRLIDEQAARPFDLQQAPMLRASLLRLGADDHVLQLVLHHIATDAWSMGILMRELITAYLAFSQGHTPDLAPLPIQYADYAHWQRSPAQQRLLAQAIDYWRHQLAGAPTLIPLPLDYPRPARPDYQGAALQQRFSAAQTQALKAYAQAHKATLFMVLLNAFNSLMQRATGAQDFIVGTDLANREHPALENLIGFFVNVLPIRARLDAGERFDTRLQRLRDDCLAAFQHQQVPFDKLVETLQPPRQPGVNPLVQVLFVMQNTPGDQAHLPGLEVQDYLQAGQQSSKFDLAVFVEEDDDQGLSVRWVYRTSVLGAATVQRLEQGFDTLLERIMTAPENALEDWQWRLQDGHDPAAAHPAAAPADDAAARSARKLSKMSKLKQTRASAVSQLAHEQVRTRALVEGQALPLVIEPLLGDLDPAHWAQQARPWINEQLRTHGGLLFRGFDLPDASAFERFAQAIEPDLYGTYGDLPKNTSGKNIYHSTPYPEQHMILFHNESSHLPQWPRKQWFFCEIPSPVGGCTPIVDCRQVLTRLPETIVDRLKAQGLLYVRHFTDKLDVRWQDFFKTEDRSEVERQCRDSGMQWQWLGDDNLRIAQHCPAIVAHPDTGELAFFNQVQLHHPACLEPEVRSNLINLFGLGNLPRNVYYGDGSVIEDEVMAVIGEAYEACAVRFKWHKGDMVMLDNMLVAHARDPFEGERKICVAMGQMMNRQQLEACQPAPQHTEEQA
ncbi:amino acid adenylation domain-containing protein [Pseudomonas sp. DTU_2021_1001937_2_SI_NGA_ILE_001]|uniref:non-ribosomal peptide synthetase n=1 Tax=Pseudomonas sp. DTU_2021_1001937_2_SI_NGA_ILE_001 TaxID=3077589 RepID=UPI0028FC2A59|nr:non-ribosomal peptide synthetase [Pseudomonas sp. DTU_2021_1001937_2_SI_NGA_ILE_001]WNW10413.1 amino acid adenylation domain-containing protein [Pseudomonas sp. DTU_2021_1001937_2_SI_NGA_ILE_001]